MNSNGIISAEYDHFLLEAQRDKALRLVLKPIIQHNFDPPIRHSDSEISTAMTEYLKSGPEFSGNQLWHRGFEEAVEALLKRAPPPYAAVTQFERPARAEIEFDPRFSEYAVLRYFACQILEYAVTTQDVVCVAQNDDIFCRVSPWAFKELGQEFVLNLPAKNDPYSLSRSNAHWREALAADQLWFGFFADLAADLGIVKLADARNDEDKTTDALGNSRGFAKRDVPFVDYAYQLLASQEASNANEAVNMLVSAGWKHVSPEATSFEEATAGSGTFDSKQKRIYDRLVKRLKNR